MILNRISGHNPFHRTRQNFRNMSDFRVDPSSILISPSQGNSPSFETLPTIDFSHIPLEEGTSKTLEGRSISSIPPSFYKDLEEEPFEEEDSELHFQNFPEQAYSVELEDDDFEQPEALESIEEPLASEGLLPAVSEEFEKQLEEDQKASEEKAPRTFFQNVFRIEHLMLAVLGVVLYKIPPLLFPSGGILLAEAAAPPQNLPPSSPEAFEVFSEKTSFPLGNNSTENSSALALLPPPIELKPIQEQIEPPLLEQRIESLFHETVPQTTLENSDPPVLSILAGVTVLTGVICASLYAYHYFYPQIPAPAPPVETASQAVEKPAVASAHLSQSVKSSRMNRFFALFSPVHRFFSNFVHLFQNLFKKSLLDRKT